MTHHLELTDGVQRTCASFIGAGALTHQRRYRLPRFFSWHKTRYTHISAVSDSPVEIQYLYANKVTGQQIRTVKQSNGPLADWLRATVSSQSRCVCSARTYLVRALTSPNEQDDVTRLGDAYESEGEGRDFGQGTAGETEKGEMRDARAPYAWPGAGELGACIHLPCAASLPASPPSSLFTGQQQQHARCCRYIPFLTSNIA